MVVPVIFTKAIEPAFKEDRLRWIALGDPNEEADNIIYESGLKVPI